MATFNHHLMASVVGILGTIVAFLCYLAPIPTFYKIFKTKSTLGFQSIPYSVALFSDMLTLYYGFLKTNALIIIAINSIGCFIETVYLVMYMIYAPPKARIFTAKLLVLVSRLKLINYTAFGEISSFIFLIDNLAYIAYYNNRNKVLNPQSAYPT